MKNFFRNLLGALPFDLTKNMAYDRQTKAIIKEVCQESSNTIDVGCHKGEILDLILLSAPRGQHFGFEPIPDLYQDLTKKYQEHSMIHIYDYALSSEKGETTFNYVISNPAYSGLKKRKYDRPNEEDTQITVQKMKLDDVVPSYLPIDLIKVDVEGAELGVFQGAVQTIKRCKPTIIFEHGLGAADMYGTQPEMIFDLLAHECGLHIYLMKDWLHGCPSMSRAEFARQFYESINYYFVATSDKKSK